MTAIQDRAMRSVIKRAPALHAKALAGGEAPGTFEAVVAVFGNEDADGEVVESGAFGESIKADLPPVVWSHDWLTPPIGATLEMFELDRAQALALVPDLPPEATGALYSKARLLIDVDAGEDVPLARHVYAALKAANGDGRSVLREFSWGGRVLAEVVELREDQPPRWRLTAITLDEWGPCLRGVNPDTALVAVKAAMRLDGRAIARAIAEGVTATAAPVTDLEAASPPESPAAEAQTDVTTTEVGSPTAGSAAAIVAALTDEQRQAIAETLLIPPHPRKED